MKKTLFSFLFVLFAFVGKSQSVCETPFEHDTLRVPSTGKLMKGECLKTVLKDYSEVKILRTADGRFFLHIIITKNFYFNRTGNLQIVSGKKVYYEKDVTQYKIDKTKGFYLIEFTRNYFITLKDVGITALVFNNAETKFTKQDAAQIKKIAACFYETYIEPQK